MSGYYRPIAEEVMIRAIRHSADDAPPEQLVDTVCAALREAGLKVVDSEALDLAQVVDDWFDSGKETLKKYLRAAVVEAVGPTREDQQ